MKRLVGLAALLILIISLILVACSSSGPAPTPVDPWAGAVLEAQTLITNASLQEHFEFYKAQAAELDQYLAVLEELRPALDALDQLKGIDLPLVGNAWDVLVKALDASVPGAGQALVTLDRELRRLLTYRGHLQSLQELDTLLEALDHFTQDPTSQTLRALDEEVQTALPRLQQAKSDVAEVRNIVTDLLKALSLLQRGIQGLGGLVQSVSEIQRALDQLNRGLLASARPLQEFEALLGTWHAYLEEDIAHLQRLHGIVYAAENYTPPTRRSWQVPGWVPISLVVLVMILYGAVIAFLAWPRKQTNIHEGVEERDSSPRLDVRSPYDQVQQPAPYQLPAPKPVDVDVGVRPARLRIISGPLSGHTFVADRDDIMVGRSPTATVRISDPYVSRQHCRLRYAQGTWFIQDLNSTSGTFVNGRRVNATVLRPGDLIQIGQTQMIFEQ